jgi:hypothetical protein
MFSLSRLRKDGNATSSSTLDKSHVASIRKQFEDRCCVRPTPTSEQRRVSMPSIKSSKKLEHTLESSTSLEGKTGKIE